MRDPPWLPISILLDMLSSMQDTAAPPAVRDINSRIAGRVKTLRMGLRMTLDELAAKSGVSRSMISLVERGESSATAVVLEKIATGLDVPLATLFDDSSAPPNPISRASERASWRDPQSGYMRWNVSPANFPSPIQISEILLPAGARVAYETAGHVPTHRQVWVLQGVVEIQSGKTTYRLSEGDCLAMQLNEPIVYRNPTRKAARYVVVLAKP
jgi:transcriptional regulator with XRE-family HTH domain